VKCTRLCSERRVHLFWHLICDHRSNIQCIKITSLKEGFIWLFGSMITYQMQNRWTRVHCTIAYISPISVLTKDSSNSVFTKTHPSVFTKTHPLPSSQRLIHFRPHKGLINFLLHKDSPNSVFRKTHPFPSSQRLIPIRLHNNTSISVFKKNHFRSRYIALNNV